MTKTTTQGVPTCSQHVGAIDNWALRLEHESSICLDLLSENSSAFKEFSRLYIGFSGGLDSTVLLHRLFALQPDKLTAVHINHGLSPNALSWEHHCKKICQDFNVPLLIYHLSPSKEVNLECWAREERYRIFAHLLQKNDLLCLGHHQDDQVETLLLHLCRGAGINGLAGIPAQRSCGQGRLWRPLLAQTKTDLEDYAKKFRLSWIEDESNLSKRFSRNFLRHELLPLLASRWPSVKKNMNQTAKHCYEAQALLSQLAHIDCPQLDECRYQLNFEQISHLPRSRIVNVVRCWLRENQVHLPSTQQMDKIIDEVIGAQIDAHPILTWQGFSLRRYRHCLYLVRDQKFDSSLRKIWKNFPEPHLFEENFIKITAQLSHHGFNPPPHAQISIRFRQGGEKIKWHGQTKNLKKLFQAWAIPDWLRHHIPLLYVDEELAVVVGYAVSDHFYSAKLGYQLFAMPLMNDEASML